MAPKPHQTHLIPGEHCTVLVVVMLPKHDAMYNCVLGKYPDGTVYLQLVHEEYPIHGKPFSFPNGYLKQIE